MENGVLDAAKNSSYLILLSLTNKEYETALRIDGD